jgi:uncharacterized protein YbjT (DUF2867 family)
VETHQDDRAEPGDRVLTEVAGTLQRTAAERGVGHIVTLSIVGVDQAPFGYFAAKLEHERAAASGLVPSAVLRATELHEFPAQLIAATRNDSQARVFDVRAVLRLVLEQNPASAGLS